MKPIPVILMFLIALVSCIAFVADMTDSPVTDIILGAVFAILGTVAACILSYFIISVSLQTVQQKEELYYVSNIQEENFTLFLDNSEKENYYICYTVEKMPERLKMETSLTEIVTIGDTVKPYVKKIYTRHILGDNLLTYEHSLGGWVFSKYIVYMPKGTKIKFVNEETL